MKKAWANSFQCENRNRYENRIGTLESSPLKWLPLENCSSVWFSNPTRAVDSPQLQNLQATKLPNVGGKVLDIRNHDGKTGLFLFLANGRDDRSRCGHRSSGEDWGSGQSRVYNYAEESIKRSVRHPNWQSSGCLSPRSLLTQKL